MKNHIKTGTYPESDIPLLLIFPQPFPLSHSISVKSRKFYNQFIKYLEGSCTTTFRTWVKIIRCHYFVFNPT